MHFIQHNPGGDASELVMRNVVELLVQKRTLLDRRQAADQDGLVKVDEELREIDRDLSRLESKETPPTAPS